MTEPPVRTPANLNTPPPQAQQDLTLLKPPVCLSVNVVLHESPTMATSLLADGTVWICSGRGGFPKCPPAIQVYCLQDANLDNVLLLLKRLAPDSLMKASPDGYTPLHVIAAITDPTVCGAQRSVSQSSGAFFSKVRRRSAKKVVQIVKMFCCPQPSKVSGPPFQSTPLSKLFWAVGKAIVDEFNTFVKAIWCRLFVKIQKIVSLFNPICPPSSVCPQLPRV